MRERLARVTDQVSFTHPLYAETIVSTSAAGGPAGVSPAACPRGARRGGPGPSPGHRDDRPGHRAGADPRGRGPARPSSRGLGLGGRADGAQRRTDATGVERVGAASPRAGGVAGRHRAPGRGRGLLRPGAGGRGAGLPSYWEATIRLASLLTYLGRVPEARALAAELRAAQPASRARGPGRADRARRGAQRVRRPSSWRSWRPSTGTCGASRPTEAPARAARPRPEPRGAAAGARGRPCRRAAARGGRAGATRAAPPRSPAAPPSRWPTTPRSARPPRRGPGPFRADSSWPARSAVTTSRCPSCTRRSPTSSNGPAAESSSWRRPSGCPGCRSAAPPSSCPGSRPRSGSSTRRPTRTSGGRWPGSGLPPPR